MAQEAKLPQFKPLKEQRLFSKAQKLSGLGLTLALATSVMTTACSQAVGPSTAAGGDAAAPADQAAPESQAASNLSTVTTPSGLKYEDIKVGTGPSPQPGQHVTVHYTGKLTNGTKFDSSVDRNEPFSFVIGQGNVIQGWDEGVMSMKVGGKRHLIIPAHLGYGAAGAGGKIPPNATLLFDVELLGVQ
jgi:peptidylprolyl isomerase